MYNQNYPPQYEPQRYERSAAALVSVVNSTMKRVYVKMTLGLIVTAITALLCSSTEAFVEFMSANSWVMFAVIIAEFALVFGINGAINRMSSTVATLLFFLFAVVNGLMLFTIFLAYSPTAIYKTFFITAGTFAAMSVYGYCTSADLSKIGSYLFMALIGLLIAMLVNWFIGSGIMDWIISIVGVFIFVGLTAWDTQQVKTMAAVAPAEAAGKLSTIGALTLYLDFINLFLFLLRIFGGGSRD